MGVGNFLLNQAKLQSLNASSKISSIHSTTYQWKLSQPTVGIDFLTRNITFQSNYLLSISRYAFDHVDKTYRLQLWDTAGQEKYKSLVPAYLRDANCAVFVFDFSRKESFADLPNWIQLYRDHAS